MQTSRSRHLTRVRRGWNIGRSWGLIRLASGFIYIPGRRSRSRSHIVRNIPLVCRQKGESEGMREDSRKDGISDGTLTRRRLSLRRRGTSSPHRRKIMSTTSKISAVTRKFPYIPANGGSRGMQMHLLHQLTTGCMGVPSTLLDEPCTTTGTIPQIRVSLRRREFRRKVYLVETRLSPRVMKWC